MVEQSETFPPKKLHLDLVHEPTPDEEGAIYTFQFLTAEAAAARANGTIWFPVDRIFEMSEPSEPMVYLAQHGLGNNTCAVKSLHRLQQMVHNALVISYYEEESQDIERHLQVRHAAGTV